MKKLVLLILLISFTSIFSLNIIKKGNAYILADKIVVKFKPEGKLFKANSIQNTKSALMKYGVSSIKMKFENTNSELDRISVVKFTSPFDIDNMIKSISKLDGVEWVEPYYVYKLADTPNDSSFSSQYALQNIKAQQAWDVTKGSKDVIIAIVDTGVDWDHPDLAANIWTNDDPINGVDDDGNGYIDDVRGWDIGGLDGTPDNDPMEDNPNGDHGTWVAGCASAVTNNSVGIASPGYNCTIMPVKVTQNDKRFSNGSPMVIYGYDGIRYAADNGANIINCSWGGFGASLLGQEVIDYAIAKGSTIIAAAGNDGLEDVIFPAGYNGVLSVGASNKDDKRWQFSNYGYFVDVMAPGESIYSTRQNDTYSSASGTSLASPIVAGVAGLVKSVFPNYSPLQIAEQIRVTSDNIDALNPTFEKKLGTGRINAFNAVSNVNVKSLRATSFSLVDKGDGDGIPERNEQFELNIDFVNYLAATSNLQVSVSTETPYITLDNSTISLGARSTLENIKSNGDIKFTVKDNAPYDLQVNLQFNYSDNNYDDLQWYSLRINPSFVNNTTDDINVTLTSRGLIGFNILDDASSGVGFKYKDSKNLMYIGSLMYGTSETNLATASSLDGEPTYDFTTVSPIIINSPGNNADIESFTEFNDNNAVTGKQSITTKQYSYSFTDPDNSKYIILKYVLKNNSTTDIDGFYVGLYTDWDIDEDDYEDNITKFDQSGGFAYAYNSDGKPTSAYVGSKILNSDKVNYYPVKNDGSDGDGIGVYDGFFDNEKWVTMTNGLKKTETGPADISYNLAAGPFRIFTGKELTVAFALAVGDSLADLKKSLDNAMTKYNAITDINDEDGNISKPLEFNLSQNYPNPFNPSTQITYQIPKAGLVTIKVFDILGREVTTLVNKEMAVGKYDVSFNASNLSSGIYFYTMKAGNFVNTKKLVLLK